MRIAIRVVILVGVLWYIGACISTIIAAGNAAIAVKEEVTQRVTGGQ